MKNVFTLLSAAIIFLSIQACQPKHAKNYNALVDQDGVLFVKNSTELELTEIMASGLVITNSNNQRVIGLAKAMLDDHTNEGEGLKKLEADKQIIGKDTIGSAHQLLIDSLSNKSGTVFDKAYLQMMIADHTQTLDLFTTASHSKDNDISAFATKTLPIIKMHLDSATAVLTSIK